MGATMTDHSKAGKWHTDHCRAVQTQMCQGIPVQNSFKNFTGVKGDDLFTKVSDATASRAHACAGQQCAS
eukprot:54722-Eustigmatos_ZCMA.PRE.1